uniref:Nematode cuticle collagen N-terminal domain-containing protein n=2 Tax=Meloidogyne TaxID=189290 RepID=A0A6V7TID3_MELEN|nr:unnamed protein product [Meloidogyne enterolobii]
MGRNIKAKKYFKMKIESEVREAAYSFVVGIAVVLSFAITFSVLVIIPISYQYINGIQHRIIDEMKFCKAV